ncbi:hypothetical protein OFN61_30390, partial [Escherichia coli]|nr:hypothetical protein [Escherichia coli]
MLRSKTEERRFYPFSTQSSSEVAQLKDMLVKLASRNAPDYTQSQIAMALLSLMVEVEPNILSIIDDASSLSDSQKAIKYIEGNIEK